VGTTAGDALDLHPDTGSKHKVETNTIDPAPN